MTANTLRLINRVSNRWGALNIRGPSVILSSLDWHGTKSSYFSKLSLDLIESRQLSNIRIHISRATSSLSEINLSGISPNKCMVPWNDISTLSLRRTIFQDFVNTVEKIPRLQNLTLESMRDDSELGIHLNGEKLYIPTLRAFSIYHQYSSIQRKHILRYFCLPNLETFSFDSSVQSESRLINFSRLVLYIA